MSNNNRTNYRNSKSKRCNSKKTKPYTIKRSNDLEVESKNTNDPNWYNRIPGLTNFVASIPFNVISNLPARVDSANSKASFVNPNICVTYHSLTSPLSATGTTNRDVTVNSITQRLYTLVRRANSGAKNYEPADLFRMIIAMAGVYARINFLMRTYGMANYYAASNRAFPNLLFKAMGIDYDSVKNNMPIMCSRINLLINRASVMKIPSGFPFVFRLATLYQNYFIDSGDLRDTIYIPMPGADGLFDINDAEELVYYVNSQHTGQPVRFPSKVAVTADQLLLDTENYVDRVLSSQDFGIMQGDLEKAFGDTNTIGLVSMPYDFTLPPIYDRTRLTQLRNADITAGLIVDVERPLSDAKYIGFDSKTGKAVGSYVEHERKYTYRHDPNTTNGKWPGNNGGSSTYTVDTRYLALDSDQLTPEWVLEATRLKSRYGVDSITGFRVFQVMPDEYLDALVDTAGQTETRDQLVQAFGTQIMTTWSTSGLEQYVEYCVDVYPNKSTYGNSAGVINDINLIPGRASNCNAVWDYSLLARVFRYLPMQVVRMAYYTRKTDANALREKKGSHDLVLCDAPIIQPITTLQLEQMSIAVWASLFSIDM